MTFSADKDGDGIPDKYDDPEAQTCTVTASVSGAGGSIAPSGTMKVNCGESKHFTITADSGYHIADVTVNGKSVGAVSGYTLQNITENTTIVASFARNSSGTTRYTITASAGAGGKISPSGSVRVSRNSDKTFTITANEGYVISDVLVDGKFKEELRDEDLYFRGSSNQRLIDVKASLKANKTVLLELNYDL